MMICTFLWFFITMHTFSSHFYIYVISPHTQIDIHIDRLSRPHSLPPPSASPLPLSFSHRWIVTHRLRASGWFVCFLFLPSAALELGTCWFLLCTEHSIGPHKASVMSVCPVNKLKACPVLFLCTSSYQGIREVAACPACFPKNHYFLLWSITSRGNTKCAHKVIAL